ncbi:hypothetical protein N1028_00825 [Herbiconiux sp. CPCC 203407]|uniref:Uncharacterized protein n=1 Tax=Herbiconiux oxytropis TaxID=2970915 RepID=A0AA42BRP9_9MICO|nr:hypothetical protein [Herbiconiux oxytropis]MCS5720953.1 hypothetical protein [Herbiconiux oxytropis]MCS5724430.1 hypothetical protein [Herbiconiux oxytropis]
MTVGPAPLAESAVLSLRCPGDDREGVALTVETLSGELLAASWRDADPSFGWSPNLG